MTNSKRFWTKWRVVSVTLTMVVAGPGSFFLNLYSREVRQRWDTQCRWMGYRNESGIMSDLAWGRIRKGDELEKVLEKYPIIIKRDELICRREDYGDWTIVRLSGHSEHVTITAKKGKIDAAVINSCCFTDVFIPESITQAEIDEFNVLREKTLLKRRQTFSTLVSFLTGNAARFYFEEGGSDSIAPLLEE